MTREDVANELYRRYRGLNCEYGFRWTISEIEGDSYGSAEMNQEPWLRMADWVIRQVEWVHLSSKWASPRTMSWDTEVMEDGEPKFTLHPEGWNPHDND